MSVFSKKSETFTIYYDRVNHDSRQGTLYSLRDGRTNYEIAIVYPFKDCTVNGRKVPRPLPQHRALAAYYNISLD